MLGNIFGNSNNNLSKQGVDFLSSSSGNSAFHALNPNQQNALLNSFKTTDTFGGISDFLGSSQFGNISAGVGAIGGIIQGIGGWDSARKQLKEQKRMNNLLHSQWQEELRRYNKYEAQRDEASKVINESAKYYTPPTQKTDNANP